jgi:hypothetical protein
MMPKRDCWNRHSSARTGHAVAFRGLSCAQMCGGHWRMMTRQSSPMTRHAPPPSSSAVVTRRDNGTTCCDSVTTGYETEHETFRKRRNYARSNQPTNVERMLNWRWATVVKGAHHDEHRAACPEID